MNLIQPVLITIAVLSMGMLLYNVGRMHGTKTRFVTIHVPDVSTSPTRSEVNWTKQVKEAKDAIVLAKSFISARSHGAIKIRHNLNPNTPEGRVVSEAKEPLSSTPPGIKVKEISMGMEDLCIDYNQKIFPGKLSIWYCHQHCKKIVFSKDVVSRLSFIYHGYSL